MKEELILLEQYLINDYKINGAKKIKIKSETSVGSQIESETCVGSQIA